MAEIKSDVLVFKDPRKCGVEYLGQDLDLFLCLIPTWGYIHLYHPAANFVQCLLCIANFIMFLLGVVEGKPYMALFSYTIFASCLIMVALAEETREGDEFVRTLQKIRKQTLRRAI